MLWRPLNFNKRRGTASKITHAELAALPITAHHFNSDWNYTIGPGPKNLKLVTTR